MSYILDALKKNKSKDEESDVPDITSEHAVSGYDYSELEEEKFLKVWLWPIVVMVLLLTIGVLVFMLLNPSANHFSQVIEQRAKVETVAEESSVTAQTAQKDQVSNPTLDSDAEILTKPVEVGEAVVFKKPSQSKNDNTRAQETKTQVSQTTPVESDETGITRADIPQLIYTTHIYATKPTDRFVMLNGRAFAEGDTVAKNLKLKEILENDIVVTFKGKEFVLPALEDVNIKQ